MKFRDEDIEKLNNSLKIEEVVGKFIEIKKAGANYKAICPFHEDTSPSFMISPSKNICKCFVCGAGGGPIKFYSNIKNISFEQAVVELAQDYNVPIQIQNENKEVRAEFIRYYEIMRLSSEYFSKQIFENNGRDALEYLSQRGVTPEIIKKYNLGYAPNNRNGLTQYLLNKGYDVKELIDVGISKDNDKGLYDSFRNRIIFPIYSLDKKVIAFGGRTLENDKDIPKYINSSDTPIFKKGNILYGLGEKSQIIKKKNYSMLMEGYMDVLMSTVHGFDVTLAPLGTALTVEQVELLKRYTDNVILCFDMDSPGQKATEKAIMLLKSAGFTIRVLELEDAKDPDESIKKFGKEKFLERVQNSIEGFDFLYKFYSKEYDITDILSKQSFIKRFKEFFQCVDDKIVKSLYIDKLSKNTEIPKEILWEELVETNHSHKYERQNVEKKIVPEADFEIEKMIEQEGMREVQTIEAVLMDNKYCSYFKNRDFENSFLDKILKYISRSYSEKKEVGLYHLIGVDNFSDTEKQRMLVLFSQKSDSLKQKTKERVFVDTMASWLRLEIKRLKKNKDIDLEERLTLKMIEDKFLKIESETEILELDQAINSIIGNKIL